MSALLTLPVIDPCGDDDPALMVDRTLRALRARFPRIWPRAAHVVTPAPMRRREMPEHTMRAVAEVWTQILVADLERRPFVDVAHDPTA